MTYFPLSRRWSILLVGALLVFIGAVGCGGTSERTVTNNGQVCLRNDSQKVSDGLQAGPITALVNFDTCLSSTCDTVLSKTCDVSLAGDTITVTSEAVIEEKSGACSDDCGFVETTCDGPEITAGDYTLKHGEGTLRFAIPTQEEVCGADARDF